MHFVSTTSIMRKPMKSHELWTNTYFLYWLSSIMFKHQWEHCFNNKESSFSSFLYFFKKWCNLYNLIYKVILLKYRHNTAKCSIKQHRSGPFPLSKVTKKILHFKVMYSDFNSSFHFPISSWKHISIALSYTRAYLR